MSATVTDAELAGEICFPERTSAAQDDELASRAPNEEYWLGWQTIIDNYLVEWGRDPSVLADDDLVPPSGRIIDRACQVAREMRNEGFLPPLRVVPDGEGGISFERRDGSYFVSLNFLEDETVEMLTFEDCKLVSRVSLA